MAPAQAVWQGRGPPSLLARDDLQELRTARRISSDFEHRSRLAAFSTGAISSP
jgi:hypothetical protein